MSQNFSSDDIDRIATLANLELTTEERTAFTAQFHAILEHFQAIQQVELPADLPEPTPPGMDTLREDVVETSGIGPERFSPHLEAGHFKVPRVIE